MMEPKIRFKGFEGEWKAPSIGEVFELRNGYTPSKAVNEFWEGGTIPWFRMEDIRTNGGILKDAIQHITPLAVKGAGLFEKNSIILATTATIGVHAMLIADSLANQRFTNFRVRKSLSNSYIDNFLYYSFFNIDEWSKKNTNSGGLLSVNMPLLVKQPLYSPCKQEQQAIASYFTSLDSQISAATSRLASLKQMKAASLQAMFPQEGETVPKIRFKGFEGEWKKVMFSETFEFLKNNSLSRAELSNEGDIVNVHYGDVLIKYGDLLNIQNEELTFIADNKIGNTLYNSCHLQNGDIIIADAAEDNTVGKCSEIVNICNKRVVSGLHTIPCRPLNRFAQGYLGHYINSESYHNQLLPLIQGSKISSISKKTLSQTIVLVPSIEEQKCIGNYFTSLDRKISLQSQRLEKLKQIKSACLDKMFV